MKSSLLLTLFVVSSSHLPAQGQAPEYTFPNPSPPAAITQVIGNTSITINYERPLARKRQVFGDLVPWHKVWRTGAGHCTRISFDKPVTVGGQRVPAGHYSLFTVPGPQEWVIILNADTTLYGSYDYDAAKDIARFVVKTDAASRHYEALAIDIDLVGSNAMIYIAWTDIRVGFLVETTTADDAMKFIREKLLTGTSKNSDSYSEAAQFLLFQKEHLTDALKLASKAIGLNKDNGAARRIKIEIYEFLHMYPEALNEIALAIDMEKNKRYQKEEDRQSEIKYWERFRNQIKSRQAAEEN